MQETGWGEQKTAAEALGKLQWHSTWGAFSEGAVIVLPSLVGVSSGPGVSLDPPRQVLRCSHVESLALSRVHLRPNSLVLRW